MVLKSLTAAILISLSSATASFSSIVDFNFSFTNGAETVTGTIFGLKDNATGAATRISVVSSFGSYSLNFPGERIGIQANEFEVSNGQVTDVDFSMSYYTLGTRRFELRFTPGQANSVFQKIILSPYRVGIAGPNQFTNTMPIVPPSAVPLPAGGLLLLSGLAGVAGLKRRLSRAA